MKQSRSQLVFINLCLLFLAAIIIVGSWWINRDLALEIIYRRKLEKIGKLVGYEVVKTLESEGSMEALKKSISDLSRISETEITLLSEEGKEWFSRNQFAAIDEHKLERIKNGEKFNVMLKDEDSLHFLKWQYYLPLEVSGEFTGVLLIEQSPQELEAIQATGSRSFALILTLIGIGTILTSVLIITKILFPLQELENMALLVANGELTCRVRDLGNNEMGRLGLALNEMASKQAQSISRFREEKMKLEVVLETLEDGIMVFDKLLRLQLINKATESILHLERERVLNKSIPELFINTELEDLIKEAMEKKLQVTGEFQTRISGTKYIQALVAPFENDTKALVLLRDITKLRRLEQVRQDFVANVSHELRTPVTSIRALVETLLDQEVTEVMQKHFLEEIFNESHRMSYIVNDLLILAQLDEGKGFSDAYKPFFLKELIKNTVTQLFADESRKIILDLPPVLPDIAAQEDRVRQVLINLLENADKYSPKEGSITIKVRRKDTVAQVSIADEGPGIPLRERERIFERFYRIDKARSRAMGGTGLGLSIVRRIVEGYGGKVWVEGEEGEGAVFIFTLPVASECGTV